MKKKREIKKITTNLYKQILKTEGLKGWEIEWHTGGGLCNYNNKTIYLAEVEYSLALFLHEVAHALCPMEKCGGCWVNITKCWKAHNNGHNAIWGDYFTALVKQYTKLDSFSMKELKTAKSINYLMSVHQKDEEIK